ncbi:asparagine synthase (glutamine-hydrolyzing) [Lagierella sp.]|uniref:asparagine synthase (glutamine-hydrolyzing) n=1 Tax=Lagierella sp. TaxID=2849657 RepID=UPI0026057AA3|nr:asparagine synthase (glutamine-hydrolyzing) [Lagierella sp.]
MCGYVGIYKLNNYKEEDNSFLEKMSQEIIHRGPDSYGYFSDDSIGLGFRRLAFLDLTKRGRQPLFTDDNKKVICFNGEIYNHDEIRQDLIKEGYSFHTETDTEVLLKGYDRYKEGILDRVRGMFAFTVWNLENKELFIARDFFGIKPMYYTTNTKDGSLLFGSEIKAFLKNPNFNKEFNEKALKPFLTNEYSAYEETFFKGVYKLEAGNYLKVKDGKIEKVTYFKPEINPTNKSLDQYIEDVEKAVEETVALYKKSHSPLGCFLSGGVDSSYIFSLAQTDKTFSVGFKDYDKDYNETNLAKELTELKGKENHKVLIDADDCFDALPKIQYFMDEPHANLSAVPMYFLSQLAASHVKGVLSGEGADELFGGYFSYGETKNLHNYRKLPFGLRRLVRNVSLKMKNGRIRRFLTKGGSHLHEEFIGQAKVFEPLYAEEILQSKYRKGENPYEVTKEFFKCLVNKTTLQKKQLLDMKYWLPGNILLKGDKMSSCWSLEVRTPFLDKKVYDVASSIPDKYKVNGDDFKIALRRAAEKVMPEDWSNRKKVGFPVPIRYWLRQEKYYNIMKEEFNSPTAKEFFHTEMLMKLLDDHFHEKAMNQRFLWTVYVFLIWYKEFFINR